MEEVKKGDRVMLVHMDDKYSNLTIGDKGTCRGVDDIGNILMNWDNGSTLSLIPGEDKYKVVNESIKFIKKFGEF
jgi:hypothetical protein